ncbi:MAG: protein kinase [Nannocystaceae bacterium]|nr:protein kinase [Nannocystaceae bacterium]
MPTCAHCGSVLAPNTRNCVSCGITLTANVQRTQPGQGSDAVASGSDAMIGRSIIGQFVVRAKLGEGGMGAVYVADQPAIGRTVVIKVIHPWLSKDPAIAAAFATEARAAARLQNPHIVSIYNYGTLTDGTLFLAMEHLEGTTLEDLVRTHGRIDPSRAVAISTQVCEALTEAHRKGIIHRDLKPSNLMVLKRGPGPSFVKVLDFGIARLDGRDTAAGTLAGTPPYMSPEQLADRPVDERSDIYALACILYEMLSGRPPFVARSPSAYVTLHATETPPPLSQVAPGVRIPPSLEACLMRALAKEPHHRPQSTGIFADELWAAMMATVDSSHVPAPSVHAPPPSNRVVFTAIAVATIVLGGVGGGLAWTLGSRSNSGHPEAVTPVSARPKPGQSPRTATDEAKPSAEIATRAALLAQPRARLESELQRVAVLHGVPPQETDAALDRFEESAQSPPFGLDPDRYARSLLTDLILAWRALPRSTDGAGRSQDELEALFLRMDSPVPLNVRRQLLNRLKTDAAASPALRAKLGKQVIEWIDIHARPAEVPTPKDEDVIEIEDAE